MELTGRLAERLAGLVGAPVGELSRMVGGASRQTWSFTAGGRPLVARCDPPGAPRHGLMAREAALLRAARRAGVPVPEVVAATDDLLVMERLYGETIARKILRDEEYAAARRLLTGQCAAALARLHTKVAADDVPDLPAVANPLAAAREQLDALGEPHPAIELGLLRLARSRPAPAGRAVVHGDFRLGNLMVDAGGLRGALDWELAHLGDPAEDLGWLCVRSWRFGGRAPVAGLGTRAELLSAYASAGGAVVAEPVLRWWEACGTLRWAVICVQQAAAHLTGAVRSVELAAIGRRTAEVELDLLELVAPGVVAAPALVVGPAGSAGPVTGPAGPAAEPAGPAAEPAGPHDRPSAAELVVAVRGWIGGLELGGHDAFLARVAANALRIVERELAYGPELARRHAARLAALGVADDAELAAQVRAGRDDAATVAAVRAAVVDKLTVADPRQLDR
jgi:aminoglycoside phosphotransferase (APT) family kinase protein